ncbi:MAG TPA: DnaJ domain-containing protein [Sphingomicrobium sp.]
MTSDCYAILGVTPTAEDVVIGAAYRALMRHYHPDTNHDPQAQARAQEISAAYAILRDPAKRAEYDAGRSPAGVLWDFEEPADVAPPMRTAGIVTAVLAVVLVGAVWAWPRPSDLPRLEPPARDAPIKARPQSPAPAVRPAPEIAKAPDLAAKDPPAPVSVPEVEAPDIEPAAAPPKPAQPARAEPVRSPRPQAPRTPDPPLVAKSEAKSVDPAPAAKPDAADKGSRVAALDRLSAGFFSQSMVHATSAKKELLLAARDRSAAQRKTCRSDSCVADAYLREIRETSAIMEGRAGPK